MTNSVNYRDTEYENNGGISKAKWGLGRATRSSGKLEYAEFNVFSKRRKRRRGGREDKEDVKKMEAAVKKGGKKNLSVFVMAF